jgi:hypothetical protein
MIDFSTPLAGMNAAAATVNAASTRLAAPATPQIDGPTNDIVSLSVGQTDFALNAKAERVQQDIAQTLLDIMA